MQCVANDASVQCAISCVCLDACHMVFLVCLCSVLPMMSVDVLSAMV